MNHAADAAQGHKTRGIVAFLPIAFCLDVSMWVPASPAHRSNIVAWEKRRSLVMKYCPVSMPAQRLLSGRACA
jgi:hypothetical protein